MRTALGCEIKPVQVSSNSHDESVERRSRVAKITFSKWPLMIPGRQAPQASSTLQSDSFRSLIFFFIIFIGTKVYN